MKTKTMKYRVTNAFGETLGYVYAHDSGEAYRKAELKFGAGGLLITMAGG